MSDTERSSAPKPRRKVKVTLRNQTTSSGTGQTSSSSTSPTSSVHHSLPQVESETSRGKRKRPPPGRYTEAESESEGEREEEMEEDAGASGADDDTTDADDESEPDETPAKKKAKTSDTPAGVLRNQIAKRDTERPRLPFSQYSSPYGNFNASSFGVNNQMKITTDQNNFNKATLGSVPPYDEIGEHLSREDFGNIAEGKKPPSKTKAKTRQAGALLTGLVMSENDRAPGFQKFARGSFRRYAATGQDEHFPLTIDNYPAMGKGGTARSRALMGKKKLTANERDIFSYTSDASDGERRDGMIARKNVEKLAPTKQQKAAKKKKDAKRKKNDPNGDYEG